MSWEIVFKTESFNKRHYAVSGEIALKSWNPVLFYLLVVTEISDGKADPVQRK